MTFTHLLVGLGIGLVPLGGVVTWLTFIFDATDDDAGLAAFLILLAAVFWAILLILGSVLAWIIF